MNVYNQNCDFYLEKIPLPPKKIDVMYAHMCTCTGEKLLYTCPNTQIGKVLSSCQRLH